MRELQRLIAATCRHTLWIVVTNQIAFRYGSLNGESQVGVKEERNYG